MSNPDIREPERGFAPPGVDDPLRDFMATYFDREDEVTRGQVVDYLDRIVRSARRTQPASKPDDAGALASAESGDEGLRERDCNAQDPYAPHLRCSLVRGHRGRHIGRFREWQDAAAQPEPEPGLRGLTTLDALTAREALDDVAWAYHTEQGHPDRQEECPEPRCQQAVRVLRMALAASPQPTGEREGLTDVISPSPPSPEKEARSR